MWGNATFAPDDMDDSSLTHGELIAFRDHVIREAAAEEQLTNMTADSAGAWILARTPKHFQVSANERTAHDVQLTEWSLLQKMIAQNYSYGIERDEEQLKKNNFDYRKWTNPLEMQCVYSATSWSICSVSKRRLPTAPTTRFYCIYGHGKETEVSFSCYDILLVGRSLFFRSVPITTLVVTLRAMTFLWK